jgi:hypothetical protein
MSNLLKKEKIVAKGVSSIATKPPVKNGKKRHIFNNHSVNEDYSALTSNNLPQTKNEEDIFVSPVLSSFKVKMKVRMNGKVNPISVDDENIIFLDD